MWTINLKESALNLQFEYKAIIQKISMSKDVKSLELFELSLSNVFNDH